jgi:hypothetical protein
VAQHLGAERYQRSPERHAERNGYRGRRGQVQNWADPDPRRLISWTGTRAHENSWTARDSRGTYDIIFSAHDLTVTVRVYHRSATSPGRLDVNQLWISMTRFRWR